MNYNNAVPKPLKFLVSDGKLIDEAGNVIAESETLKDLYTKWAPEVKKYLLSDGSVVDENNNLIIKNDYYKKMYDQADPKVAKYLHADGTVDENPGGGPEVSLQENKNVSINFEYKDSPSTQEILPSNNYDAMKKVTLTLNEGDWYKFNNDNANPRTIYARKLADGAVKIYLCNVSSNEVTIEKKEGSMSHMGDWLGNTWILTYNEVTYTKIGDAPNLIL